MASLSVPWTLRVAPLVLSESDGRRTIADALEYSHSVVKEAAGGKTMVMIDAELRRAGEPGLDLAALPEIDLLRVWAQSERRTLDLAVQRFLGHGHSGAHSALSDAEALLPLARAMKQAWALEDYDLLDRSRSRGEVDRSRRLR